jgi:thermitase
LLTFDHKYKLEYSKHGVYWISQRLDYMKHSLLVAAMLLALSTTVAAEQKRYNVIFTPGVTPEAVSKAMSKHGGAVDKRLGKSNSYRVKMNADKRADLEQTAGVESVEEDKAVAPDLVPNDTYFPNSYHHQRIFTPAAWDTATGQGIVIAVADTGTNPHPDLRILPGWNVYLNNNESTDIQGHGTWVAGTIGGILNNGIGISGVAGNSTILPIRIAYDNTGYAYYSDMADAVYYAADNGARAVNISYMAWQSTAVQTAAGYMRSKGGLVFSSAGNSQCDITTVVPNVIVVGATDSSNNKASFSCFGAGITVVAPGVGIYATSAGGGYGTVSGTSFSSPITAGVAGLVWSANPRLTPAQVESILKSTTTDIGAVGFDTTFGWGLVNAAAAVAAATTVPVDTTPPSVTLTAPATGNTVVGIVPVTATAVDNVAVTRVDLFVNDVLFASDTSSPYSFSWDTRQLVNGTYTLRVKAFDEATNSAEATSVVAVNNPIDVAPPTVQFTSPANGSTITGRFVDVRVTAADDTGVQSISLSIGGKVVATSTTSTLSHRWNTNKVRGTVTLTATATDRAGKSASTAITVTK